MKYDSCSQAHASQKGTSPISTVAGRRQGLFGPLPTLHCFSCLLVILIKKPSFDVRLLPSSWLNNHTKSLRGRRGWRILQKEDITRPLVG